MISTPSFGMDTDVSEYLLDVSQLNLTEFYDTTEPDVIQPSNVLTAYLVVVFMSFLSVYIGTARSAKYYVTCQNFVKSVTVRLNNKEGNKTVDVEKADVTIRVTKGQEEVGDLKTPIEESKDGENPKSKSTEIGVQQDKYLKKAYMRHCTLTTKIAHIMFDITKAHVVLLPLVTIALMCGSPYILKFVSKKALSSWVTVFFSLFGASLVLNALHPYFAFILKGTPYVITAPAVYLSKDLYIRCRFLCLLCALVFSVFIGSWYLNTQHWVANNFIAISFIVTCIEIIRMDTVLNYCLLFLGILACDIFWALGSDVITTITGKIETPLMFLFPQNIAEDGFMEADNFFGFRLVNIIIPGLFLALLLKFDLSLHREAYVYFMSTSFTYSVSLMVATDAVLRSNVDHPILLYLMIVCIGTSVLVAAFQGDLRALFRFKDDPWNVRLCTTAKDQEINKC